MQKNQIISTTNLAKLGLLGAISIALVYFIHFPIFPAAPYLVYDPADITLILSSFVFGPLSALLLTAVVSLIQGLTVSQEGGFVGIIMHFVATGSLVLVSGYLFKKSKTIFGSAMSLLTGIITMTGVMIILNLIIQPIVYGYPVKAIIDMILPILLPFNLIKATINSIIAFALFKAIGKFLINEK